MDRESYESRTADLFGFLAILCAVNWIDLRAQKEEAIHSNGPDLWQNLSIVIGEVCESFNNRYGGEYSNVKVQPENHSRIRVLRKTTKTIGPRHTRPQDVSLQIIYEPKRFRITAACASGAVNVNNSVDIQFDQNEDIRPYLSKAGRRLSDDEASEILLEEFLFNENFLNGATST